jgi:hypothetical protein
MTVTLNAHVPTNVTASARLRRAPMLVVPPPA